MIESDGYGRLEFIEDRLMNTKICRNLFLSWNEPAAR